MRKIKLSVANSLDNYIARPDGGFDWILSDQDYGRASFFKSLDTVLIGRKMHDLMVKMSSPSFPGMKNYVFSRTKSGRGEGGVEFISGELKSFIALLREQPGKDIWLAGGGELVHSFLRERLVDEIRLGVQPVLLGEGIPLFPPAYPQTNLRLLKCEPYPTGLVMLAYEMVR